jgi:hypothetical protein
VVQAREGGRRPTSWGPTGSRYEPDCDLNIVPLVPWPWRQRIFLTMMAATWVTRLGLRRSGREKASTQTQREFRRVCAPFFLSFFSPPSPLDVCTTSSHMGRHLSQAVSSIGVRGRSPWSVITMGQEPELVTNVVLHRGAREQ